MLLDDLHLDPERYARAASIIGNGELNARRTAPEIVQIVNRLEANPKYTNRAFLIYTLFASGPGSFEGDRDIIPHLGKTEEGARLVALGELTFGNMLDAGEPDPDFSSHDGPGFEERDISFEPLPSRMSGDESRMYELAH